MSLRDVLLAAAFIAWLVALIVSAHLGWYPFEPVLARWNLHPARTPAAALGFTAWREPRALPEVHFADEKGRAVSLADFRGKLVLLNVWATWCTPCVEEMPALDRLNGRLRGPRFQVVALSIDRMGAEGVRELFDRLELRTLPVYADTTGRAASELRALALPTALLVDPAGREIGRFSGARAWDGEDAVALINAHFGAHPAIAGGGS